MQINIPSNEETWKKFKILSIEMNIDMAHLLADIINTAVNEPDLFDRFINKNYSNASFLTSISYNPHLLTFLYNNPNFVYQLKNNIDICETFIFSQTISLCATDLYKFYYNTIPSIYFNNILYY